VNHARFPKENHLPDWARRDNKVTEGDRAEQFLDAASPTLEKQTKFLYNYTTLSNLQCDTVLRK